MSPMSRLTRAAAGLYDRLATGAAKVALRSLTKGSAGEARLAQLLGPYFTQSPGAWAGDRTLQVLAHRHWVFVAVNAIAQTLAEETPICASVRGPLDLQRQMSQAKAFGLPRLAWRGNYMTPWDRKKALTPTRPEEELEVHGAGHKLVDLLEHPNEEDTGSALWEEFGQFLELTGEAYLWKVRNGAGRVSELWVIPSNWVWPIGLGRRDIIDFYEVRPWGSGGSMPQGGVRFDTDEIIAVRFKSPWSKVRGGSTCQAGSVMIDVYDSIQACRYNSMKNGVNVGSFFQLPADMEADPQKIKQAEARMMEKLGGEKGFRMPVVLAPGVTLNRPPAPYEMDFIQSSDQARDQILSLFGVPYPVAMIVGGATYENADAAWRGFYRRTMRRRFRLLGQALTKDLAPEFGDDLRVFYKDPSLDAPEQVNADIDTDYKCGAITPNEIRSLRGREPYDDDRMDKPWLPMTLAPFGMGVDADDLGSGLDLSHSGKPETENQPQDDDETVDTHSHDRTDNGGGGAGGSFLSGLGLPDPAAGRRKKFDPNEPRRPDGEWGGGGSSGPKPKPKPAKPKPASAGTVADTPPSEKEPSEKAKRAKAAHVMVDKSVQRYAEEYNEPRFAKVVKGESLPDGEPIDVLIAGKDSKPAHGVELKTMTVGNDDKITMNKYAQVRKIVWESEKGAEFHTVVSDDRRVFNGGGAGVHDESKGRTYYYRRGVAGSARIGSLHKCKDEAELKKLMKTPADKLPAKAQRSDGHLRVGEWKPLADGSRGFANSETGEVVRPKK